MGHSGTITMIGQTLGHYRIVEKIGEGGMGPARKSPPLQGLEGWTIHGLTTHVKRPHD